MNKWTNTALVAFYININSQRVQVNELLKGVYKMVFTNQQQQKL